MKIVVCCSMTQLDEAKWLQKMIEIANPTNIVTIPDPVEKGKTLTDHRKDYYDKISDADLVVALMKHDRTIGDSVSHELAFTKYLGKPHLIIEMVKRHGEVNTKEDLAVAESDDALERRLKEKATLGVIGRLKESIKIADFGKRAEELGNLVKDERLVEDE